MPYIVVHDRDRDHHQRLDRELKYRDHLGKERKRNRRKKTDTETETQKQKQKQRHTHTEREREERDSARGQKE